MASAEADSSKHPTWQLAPDKSEVAAVFERELSLSPLLARILANRGFDSPAAVRDFLNPTLGQLADPFALRDMDRAVERVARAIENKEKIAVFGDYDVDGVTSTALALRLLRWLGAAEAEYYIPHRVNEGYGLSPPALQALAARGVTLALTVDTGINGLDEVEFARRLGMDVVVTDHHLPGPVLPQAAAAVNPNRADCEYPFKGLAGVGVAFKFAHALAKHMGRAREESTAFLKDNLDLVAIGSISDVAPLLGENRVLAQAGLKQAAQTTKTGLRVMMSQLGLSGPSLSTYAVGFVIGPRLNAAGRLNRADLALELLMTESEARAKEIADYLDKLNDERRAVESEILDEAVEAIESDARYQGEPVLVVAGENWHQGVIGIVASRLVAQYNRPAFVLSLEKAKGRVKGSGRSVPGFDLVGALAACAEFLQGFGGHALAAGMRLEPAQIQSFRNAVNAHAASLLERGQAGPVLEIHASTTIADLDMPAVEALAALEPYGCDNPRPIVALRGVRLVDRPRMVGSNHLRLTFGKDGLRLGAIGFGLARHIAWLGSHTGPLDVAGVPSVNEFNGRRSVQLEIKDIRPAG